MYKFINIYSLVFQLVRKLLKRVFFYCIEGSKNLRQIKKTGFFNIRGVISQDTQHK